MPKSEYVCSVCRKKKISKQIRYRNVKNGHRMCDCCYEDKRRQKLEPCVVCSKPSWAKCRTESGDAECPRCYDEFGWIRDWEEPEGEEEKENK